MQFCEECGTNPATVHVTHISNETTVIFHLCEECARKKGIAITVTQDLEPQKEKPAAEPEQPEKKPACPGCGLLFSEFKSKGFLGCSGCYRHFEHDIEVLLKRVHGSTAHVGKAYAGRNAVSAECKDLRQLQGELADAIKREAFELAASIRDTMHSLGGKNARGAPQ